MTVWIVDSVDDTDGDDDWQRSKSSKHTVVLFDLKLEASGTYRWVLIAARLIM